MLRIPVEQNDPVLSCSDVIATDHKLWPGGGSKTAHRGQRAGQETATTDQERGESLHAARQAGDAGQACSTGRYGAPDNLPIFRRTRGQRHTP